MSIVDFLFSSHVHIEPLFQDIGTIIIVAALFAFVLRFFKQPIIPAYVLAGILIGPRVLGIVSSQSVITTLSELGVAFLLFVVGMEMDLMKLRTIGLIALIGGTAQILLLSFLGWFMGVTLGFSVIESLYAGMIVAFSSTMVVIKLLSDRGELHTLHGRIIIGFLLMEDIFAIIALLVISNVQAIAEIGLASMMSLLVFKLGILVAFSYFFGRVLLPPLFKSAAKSQEILFLFSISVCFLFSFLTSLLGLSVAIGAFIGGLSIAHLPYNYEIAGKIKALRVFFTTIFFTALGMELNFAAFGQLIVPLILFVVFISFFKPFLTAMLCSLFGYRKRTSVLASINLAQTSEFSLIIVALGLSPAVGHLTSDSIIPTLAVLLCIITMVITSYTIKYNNTIYNAIKEKVEFLNTIGSGNRELDIQTGQKNHHIILIGYDRIGYHVLPTLEKKDKNILIVDYNPELIRSLIAQGKDCLYGDVSDTEIMKRLRLTKAEMLISTVPNMPDNLTILNYIKHHNPKLVVFLTATRVDDALELYAKGADYVILAHFLGGHHVSVMLEDEFSLDRMLKTKLTHIKELKHRKKLGHYHTHTTHKKEK